MCYYRFFDTDPAGIEERDIEGKAYECLIHACEKHSSFISMRVTCDDNRYVQNLEKFRVFRTDGIKYVYSHYYSRDSQNAQEEVRYYYLNSEMIEILLSMSDSVFKWINGWGYRNPEDLAFYRADGTVFFNSIVHEGKCYLYPRDGEDVQSVVDDRWELVERSCMLMNIYRDFKQELGHINATNQYIEMLHRRFIKENGTPTDSCLENMASEVMLSLSKYSEGIELRMARNYIIGIHSCLERFLIAFKDTPGTPAYGEGYNPKEDDNRLFWTLNKVYGEIPDDVLRMYYVCNYYRLVRNNTVHSKDTKLRGNLKVDYDKAKKIGEEYLKSKECLKLDAPKEPKDIGFDDQVLFSRTARNIVERIVYDSKYRLNLLISNDFDDILKKVRPVINNPKRMRSIIDAYICRKYAKVAFEEEEWEEAIAGITERIQNEEGH